MKKIKYRINEFYKRESVPEFSQYEKDYKLDEKTNELIEAGEKDLQAEIQSFEECALDRVLDRFLKGDVLAAQQLQPKEEQMGTYERMQFDLADLAEEYERVYELKEKYHLDDSLSYSEVMNVLKDKQVALSSRITKLQEEKEKEEREKKEIK